MFEHGNLRRNYQCKSRQDILEGYCHWKSCIRLLKHCRILEAYGASIYFRTVKRLLQYLHSSMKNMFLAVFLGITIATVHIQSVIAGSEDLSEISDEDFGDYIKKNKLVVAKFYTNWCPHCVDTKASYETAAKLIGKESAATKVVRIDCDVAREIANKEKVDQLPMMFLYKDGKKSGQFDGDMKDAESIAKWAKENSS